MKKFKSVSRTNSLGEKITIREYRKTDAAAVLRIFRESDWVPEKTKAAQLHEYCTMALTLVGEINGAVECVTTTTPADMVYLDDTLAVEACTGVITGMPARRKGIALEQTALMMMHNAAAGMPVSALGVFEQGFYDRLGYGSAHYSHRLRCDLGDLKTDTRARAPVRITDKDWQAVHDAINARRRFHGAMNLLHSDHTKLQMKLSEDLFGLGYKRPDGSFSHLILGELEGEHGPLYVEWMVWRTTDELRELLALLASLGDQIWVASMPAPPGFQLSDLVAWPLKQRPSTLGYFDGKRYATGTTAQSPWQFRIMDLPLCVSKVKLPAGAVEFNLALTDPLDRYAERSPSGWQTLTGDWVVKFGASSSAKRGKDAKLPTLTASVGAFSRLWGGASALGLSVTDDFTAPDDLIAALDATLNLPHIEREWDF